ncbi:MAG: permease [Acidobacteriota bacterium]
MNLATLTMVVLAAALWTYARWRGDGSHWRGFLRGLSTLRNTLPLLVLAFIVVGYATVLVPESGLPERMGPASGGKGLLLALGIGTLIPGGPYVALPLISTLNELGIGLGATLALINGWAGLSLLHVAWEIRYLGWRFTAVRWTLMMFSLLLIGYLAQVIFERSL